MKIFTSLDNFPSPPDGCVVTVGNFDGVHRGHQDIFARARSLAQENSLPLIGITFDPSAAKVLRPDNAPRILTPLEIKTQLLAQQGLDQLIVVKTTRKFLDLSPAQFVENILLKRLALRHIVEGPTFGFGNRRLGTTFSLEELATRFGFQAHMVSAFTIILDERKPPTALSSTLLRHLVRDSLFPKVKQCLGRDYELAGRVCTGLGRGRELGFPTANLEPYNPDQLVPQDGVYAGFARLGENFEDAWKQEKKYPAAISIGRGETFSDGLWQIEAHLLDYEANPPSLLRHHIIITLIERLRPQKKFNSNGELIQAIENDCQTIRQTLKAR